MTGDQGQSARRSPVDLAAWDTGMTSDYHAFEGLLWQNLRLRRQLGGEVIKATYGSTNQRDERPLGLHEVPEISPAKDDLEELRRELKFRRELKLKRELGTKLPKGENNSQNSNFGVRYRFGQFFYWVCLTLGLIWIGPCLFVAIDSFAEQNQLLTSATWAVILVPPLLLHGIGRDLRFALSGR